MTPGPDDLRTAEVLAQDPPRRRRVPRTLVLTGVTALVIATGAGVAAAALSPTPTQSPTPSAAPTEPPSATPSEKAPGHGWGWGRGRGMGRGAIHGQYVVPDANGGYVTVATQYGDVTALDQDSITVKSEDGYTKEYALTGETRVNAGREGLASVKTGAKVFVHATVSGETATAVAVFDATGRDRGEWHGRRHHDRLPGGPGQTASPAPTSTS
ncbi:hypothetical protein FHU36_004677 [Nonomuraea muscovyensis]|uniref:DUF5666 domain-containing protein n=1 Tax=Nonomuraea muscovyensis TaxID=1124761 RepID=A0A7X0C435_9ACTN|nr:hypothetical protein [Nonomuraea muscovyensis]MBB6348132.1 hypothetical protein [Nonomuraea muscovyensis]